MTGFEALQKAAAARRMQSARSFSSAPLPGPWSARARKPGFLGEVPLSATMASTDIAMYRKPRASPAFSNPNLPAGGRPAVHPRNNRRARPLNDYITRRVLPGRPNLGAEPSILGVAISPSKFAAAFILNFATTWGLIEILPSYLDTVVSRYGTETGKRKARNRLAIATAAGVTLVNTILLPYLATE